MLEVSYFAVSSRLSYIFYKTSINYYYLPNLSWLRKKLSLRDSFYRVYKIGGPGWLQAGLLWYAPFAMNEYDGK